MMLQYALEKRHQKAGILYAEADNQPGQETES